MCNPYIFRRERNDAPNAEGAVPIRDTDGIDNISEQHLLYSEYDVGGVGHRIVYSEKPGFILFRLLLFILCRPHCYNGESTTFHKP